MATISILYNPKVSAFFNSDGNLVINDVTGDYGNGNDEGWGGFNPPKSSITSIKVAVLNQSDGEGYFNSVPTNIDIALAPFEFVVTNGQVVIDGTAFAILLNIYDFVATDFDSAVLKTGIYSISFEFEGTYQIGVDTINWTSTENSEQIFLQAVNTQSDCLLNIYKSMTNKNCKENKRFNSLNRYLSMLSNYESYVTLSSTLSNDFAMRKPKITSIWDKINKLCTGREGGCKC